MESKISRDGRAGSEGEVNLRRLEPLLTPAGDGRPNQRDKTKQTAALARTAAKGRR